MNLVRIVCLALCLCPSAAFSETCQDDFRIQSAIAALGTARAIADADPHLKIFEESPSTAVCHLVAALKPIPLAQLGPQDNSNNDEWIVIWSLRALRYLTGGLNFQAGTNSIFGGGTTVREDLLLKDGSTMMPFFRQWPSRNVIFLAPTDAQSQIIAEWCKWLVNEAATYSYHRPESLDDWYF